MKRIILALATFGALLWVGGAQAQTTVSARVVASCGGITYSAGSPQPLTMDTTGTLCTVSGGGGSSNPAAGATGAAVPADASYNGLNVGGNLVGQTGVNPTGSVEAAQTDISSINGVTLTGVDPCTYNAKSEADFESTSSGAQIVAGVSAKKIYICHITAFASTATNFSLIEGTGSSVCTSGSPTGTYLNTGVTAANGAALAANGGLTAGDGQGTVAHTGTNAYNLCVAFATTNTPQVNVHVSYVIQ